MTEQPTSTETTHPAIELLGLARRYGREFVLKDVNLVVSPGKVVILKGDNGTGKTTLLKVLSTRLRPTRGSVKIFGHDAVKRPNDVRKSIAYLSVSGGSYPSLTAFENLKLTAQLYDLEFTNAEIGGKLEAVGLLHARNKLVREFSSGMKKRLGIARVLLSDAELWLLDEPYNALDENGQRLVDELLKTARLDGRTVVMASHDLERSNQFADSVLQLQNGLLKRPGVVTEIEMAGEV
ncbi:MAG: heme ABC exporter ATP-binding protein CcmA [Trueperaceae bacterium]